MNDPQTSPDVAPATTAASPDTTTAKKDKNKDKDKKERKPLIVFTDDGCRSEIRLGALLILAAVFFPLFFGPALCVKIGLVGLLLVLIGVPLQALEGRGKARPGYPWKLALAFVAGGLFMVWDLLWREQISDPIRLQELPMLCVIAGIWMLAWWPVSRPAGQAQEAAG